MEERLCRHRLEERREHDAPDRADENLRDGKLDGVHARREAIHEEDMRRPEERADENDDIAVRDSK